MQAPTLLMSSTMGTSTKVTTVSRQLALNMNARTTAAWGVCTGSACA
jgi:hypothetical protein